MARRGAVGLLRETKSNWERRCALTPSHVASLVEEGVEVLVQPANHREFRNEEYERAGAKITNNLADATVILGVKEQRPADLLPHKTYMFFGHVIKAQPYNMGLLDSMLEKVRFIDYERIQNPKTGERLVCFGRYAGIAGMISFLRGVGERLLTMGYKTPFLHMPSAYMFRNLDEARAAMRLLGEGIKGRGLPEALQPLVVGITGTGNVSVGAQEMFDLLPHTDVAPDELASLLSSRRWNQHTIYKTVVSSKDYVQRADGMGHGFDRAHYYTEPGSYLSIFEDKIAPYCSLLVNCVYWDKRFPRLITRDGFRRMCSAGQSRLIALSDISCDFAGSIEWLDKFTSIQQPFYIYNPAKDRNYDTLNSAGVLVHSVDHLPAEVPVDASHHFGNALLPFLPAIARSDPSLPLETSVTDLPMEVFLACVTAHGELTSNYKYISTLRRTRDPDESVASSPAATFRLHGHLVDSGLISCLLTIVENAQCTIHIIDFVPGASSRTPTNLEYTLRSHSKENIVAVEQRLIELIKVLPGANATLTCLDS